jgi:L-ascorbate metabolism protein UlaG (beta-lactamase superfamily)
MKFQQVRNATILIEYAGKKFLVDPMLAEKGAFQASEGTVNSHLSTPTAELPLPTEVILDVDAVIVTHTHRDHWDEVAKQLVPKDMLIFVQDDKDAADIRAEGFRNIRVLDENTDYEGITMTKTPGQHGSDYAIAHRGRLGEVCGIVFRHVDEKTLYIAGDTVWNQYVSDNLKEYAPDIVILNSGDAQVIGLGSIIMGKQDVYEVHKAAPKATLIASHMESVNHATLTRKELREFIGEKAISPPRVLVPEDGEVYTF